MGRLILVVYGLWAVLGIILGLQIFLNAHARGQSIGLSWALGDSLRRYAIYATLTFPILWVCRRFTLESHHWSRSILAHGMACAGCNLSYATLRTATALDPQTMRHLPASAGAVLDLARRNVFEVSWMYASIVFVVLALQYHRNIKEREVREADLKRQMAEYELQILKLQLHPHFLFNTLNGISALMARDVATAREMLLHLSELLRFALSRSADTEVSLREELEFVKAYLQLEQMRFGERLTVRLQIAPATLDARVPNMIIQPLVENGIQYGIAQLGAGGRIELVTERADATVRIRIVNDGPVSSFGSLSVRGSGIGLRYSRSRLEQLFGHAYRLELLPRAAGGVELHLEIPYRESRAFAECDT